MPASPRERVEGSTALWPGQVPSGSRLNRASVPVSAVHPRQVPGPALTRFRRFPFARLCRQLSVLYLLEAL